LAMFDLGVLLNNLERYDDAEPWFREAAERGDPLAANYLGTQHASRLRRDPASDPRFDPGPDRPALATMYALGRGHAETEFVDTMWSLLRTADSGDPAVWYLIGDTLADAADFPDEAKTWLGMAAERGHLDAARRLGEAYEAEDRSAEAERWYRRAAERGHGRAMYRLGRLYENLGNRTAAAHWHREGIKVGEQKSLARLGGLLVAGGQPDQAARLYRAALQHGHPDAGRLLEGLQRR
jgi:TPR repeat protein